jgi:hypothetical protein
MASGEIPKKEEKDIQKEDKKPNSIADRIKNMTSGEIPKKEEKKEDKKPTSFADRIKNMSGGTNNSSSIKNKPEQPKPPAAKRGSAVESNINKFSGVKKNETSTKPQPANSFGSKLSQLNEMFKKQGIGQKGTGGHRPSMIMMGMPQNFRFGKGMPMPGSSSGGGSKASEIIKEEPDKMKAGYDPAANLQKTLDSVVVVKKDKKKKKKPAAFKG